MADTDDVVDASVREMSLANFRVASQCLVKTWMSENDVKDASALASSEDATAVAEWHRAIGSSAG